MRPPRPAPPARRNNAGRTASQEEWEQHVRTTDSAAPPSGGRRPLSPWEAGRRWLAATTFNPSWLPGPWGQPFVGYGTAVLLQGAAVGIVLLLAEVLHGFAFPSLLSLLFITLTALAWGAGPSLLATLSGAILLTALLHSPTLHLRENVPVHVVSIAIYLAAGSAASLLASQIERTRREAHARAAHEAAAAAHLDAIIEALADALYVYDNDGRILRLNAAARALLPLAGRPDYFERPIAQRTTPLAARDTQGRLLPADRWPLARVLRGEIVTGADAPNLLIRGPDGGDRAVNISGAPVRDAAGRTVGAAVSVRDVTEQRALASRTQGALQALLAMAEALMLPAQGDQESTAPGDTDAAMAHRLAELAHRVLDCHHVSLVLVAAGREQEGLRPLAIAGLAPDQAKRWHNMLRAAPAGLYGVDPGLRARLEADEITMVDMRQAPYRDLPNPSGAGLVLVAPLRVGAEFIGILTVDRGSDARPFMADEIALARATARLAALVIERARLQDAQAEAARLAELDLLRSQFIGNVSHDLQTPLTAILVPLGLLAKSAGARLTPAERELLAAARHSGERLRLRLADLLATAEMEGETLRLDRAPLDLRDVVARAAGVIRPLAQAKRQMLEADLPTTLPIEGDARWLEHVALNLLANAHRHTPPGTRIIVEGRVADGAIRLLVRDTGPGIPAEDVERIFRRSYRRGGGSTGLGLSIVRALVELHGGRAWAESTEGQGAAFHVTFPLPAPEAAGDTIDAGHTEGTAV